VKRKAIFDIFPLVFFLIIFGMLNVFSRIVLGDFWGRENLGEAGYDADEIKDMEIVFMIAKLGGPHYSLFIFSIINFPFSVK
jgi:hypothetical protein